MPNLQDHVIAVGEQNRRPFDELDALVLSQLVYMPLEGVEMPTNVGAAWPHIERHTGAMDLFQKKRRELFRICAGLPRYRSWRIADYVNVINQEKQMQFCACTFILPDGERCIAFRGTDSHVIGWKEDFNMSFTIVPAQHAAAQYVLRAASQPGPIRLCGHSKGGNLGVYAAATADAHTRAAIRAVYTFDGPGMDEETFHSEGYALVHDRIESYIPHSSVVGMLLWEDPSYTVVRSSALGILQHDAMTWQIRDGAFVVMDAVDTASRLTDEAVTAWLAQLDEAQRRLLVDTVYQVVGASQAVVLSDLSTDVLDNAARMLSALRGLDTAVRRDVLRMFQLLIRTGADGVAREILGTLLSLRKEKTKE